MVPSYFGHPTISTAPSAQRHQHSAISTAPSAQRHQHSAISTAPSAQRHQHSAISTAPSAQRHQHSARNTAPSAQRQKHSTISMGSISFCDRLTSFVYTANEVIQILWRELVASRIIPDIFSRVEVWTL
ncbi:hypothetical protein BD560DRAFT_435328 [Blakeslea trispora]|nr:hypothetical protein BD560DRAFT_435328 [Blakeslea trispora]